ncbi:hypothetical protein [Paenibacillus phytorum]|uniref:hypothetical protein n=1 Tax=Paenibacillus phytorum TaxID=2654977 RepID=UPI001FE483AB
MYAFPVFKLPEPTGDFKVGTQTFHFVDTNRDEIFGMTGNMNPTRAASIINVYTLNFFDKYLKNKDGSLLEGPNGEYPEVKFATSLFTEE